MFPGMFKNRKVTVKRVRFIDITGETEENILKEFNHPSVVKLFYFYSDDTFKQHISEVQK